MCFSLTTTVSITHTLSPNISAHLDNVAFFMLLARSTSSHLHFVRSDSLTLIQGFATAVGALSAIAAILFMVPKIYHFSWSFVVDAVLFLMWVIVFGIFGKVGFLPSCSLCRCLLSTTLSLAAGRPNASCQPVKGLPASCQLSLPICGSMTK